MTDGFDDEGRIRITISDDTVNSGAACVAASLAAEIAAGFGPRDEMPLSVVAYEAGAVVGGLNGATHWGWCYIRHFWVRQDWRRRGLGIRLLAEAERRVRGRGCAGLYVDTFDAGAAHFYERAGFGRVGQIDGFPPGHARLFLRKRLM
jgi:ribosomal protein S18 acetylase RimI-like enzyme